MPILTVMPLDHLLTVLVLQHPTAAAARGEDGKNAATVIEGLVAFVDAMIEAVLDSAGDDARAARCFEA